MPVSFHAAVQSFRHYAAEERVIDYIQAMWAPCSARACHVVESNLRVSQNASLTESRLQTQSVPAQAVTLLPYAKPPDVAVQPRDELLPEDRPLNYSSRAHASLVTSAHSLHRSSASLHAPVDV